MSHNPILPENKLIYDGQGQQGYIAIRYLEKNINLNKSYLSYGNFNGIEKLWKYGDVLNKKDDPFKNDIDYIIFFPEGGNSSVLRRFYPKRFNINKIKLFNHYRYKDTGVFEIKKNNVSILKIIKMNHS